MAVKDDPGIYVLTSPEQEAKQKALGEAIEEVVQKIREFHGHEEVLSAGQSSPITHRP
jgi:hypothetical protein